MESKKNKIIIFIISMLLMLIVIALYFLEASQEWDVTKILSCVLVSMWVFFLIPSFRKSYIKNKDKDIAEWVEMGYWVGVSGICLPFLLAPVYGIIYYFMW